MGTIAHRAGAGTPTLDPLLATIGPVQVAAAVRALLEVHADGPPPADPEVAATLRTAATVAADHLVPGHPLSGADLRGVGTPMLLRLLARLAQDLDRGAAPPA